MQWWNVILLKLTLLYNNLNKTGIRERNGQCLLGYRLSFLDNHANILQSSSSTKVQGMMMTQTFITEDQIKRMIQRITRTCLSQKVAAYFAESIVDKR